MILILLVLIPLLSGILSFAVRGEGAKTLAAISSMITLAASAYVSGTSYTQGLDFSCDWIPMLGTKFTLVADGMSSMLCLLTGILPAQQLQLPTANHTLFDAPAEFFQFVDRDFDGDAECDCNRHAECD